MSAYVIAIANQKGGVGKTTTAINLSSCLVECRRKVLLIDIDPQANATSGLGIEKSVGGSVYPALMGEGDLVPQIRPTAYKRFDIIPSEIDLAGAEVDIVMADDYLSRMRKAMEPLREQTNYDYIFIDCPPSLGVLTVNALTAADALLIPLQCEYYALEGLSTITGVVEELRTNGSNPTLTIDGILMTMFSSRTKLSQQVVQDVADHFPDLIYETLIPRNIRLSEAPSYGQPVIVYDRHSTGAAAYRLLAREFLRRHEGGPPVPQAAAVAAPAGETPAPPAAAAAAEPPVEPAAAASVSPTTETPAAEAPPPTGT